MQHINATSISFGTSLIESWRATCYDTGRDCGYKRRACRSDLGHAWMILRFAFRRLVALTLTVE
jgi:hypothetical protein